MELSQGLQRAVLTATAVIRVSLLVTITGPHVPALPLDQGRSWREESHCLLGPLDFHWKARQGLDSMPQASLLVSGDLPGMA